MGWIAFKADVGWIAFKADMGCIAFKADGCKSSMNEVPSISRFVLTHYHITFLVALEQFLKGWLGTYFIWICRAKAKAVEIIFWNGKFHLSVTWIWAWGQQSGLEVVCSERKKTWEAICLTDLQESETVQAQQNSRGNIRQGFVLNFCPEDLSYSFVLFFRLLSSSVVCLCFEESCMLTKLSSF